MIFHCFESITNSQFVSWSLFRPPGGSDSGSDLSLPRSSHESHGDITFRYVCLSVCLPARCLPARLSPPHPTPRQGGSDSGSDLSLPRSSHESHGDITFRYVCLSVCLPARCLPARLSPPHPTPRQGGSDSGSDLSLPRSSHESHGDITFRYVCPSVCLPASPPVQFFPLLIEDLTSVATPLIIIN